MKARWKGVASELSLERLVLAMNHSAIPSISARRICRIVLILELDNDGRFVHWKALLLCDQRNIVSLRSAQCSGGER